MTKVKFLFSIGLLGLLCLLPGSLRADGFGLMFVDQGYVDGGAVVSPGYPGYPSPSFPGSYIVANSSQLSASDSWSLIGSNGGTSKFAGSIDGRFLHAYSNTATAAPSEGSGYNGTNLSWYDTFHFSGPAGQTGQYLINYSLDGPITVTGNDDVFDLVNDLFINENGTLSLPDLGFTGGSIGECGLGPCTGSVLISAAAGETDTLGEELELRNDIGAVNGSEAGSLTVDDSNTATFTVTPLTPGFGYTTASGLSYAPASTTAVPEPSSVALLLAGIGFLLVMRKRIGWGLPQASVS
jgi:hypothetical protein